MVVEHISSRKNTIFFIISKYVLFWSISP